MLVLTSVSPSTHPQAFTNLFADPIMLLVPDKYAKWVPMALTWAARSIGVSIAYFIQRVISAAHSALRGAQMAVTGATKYAQRRGYATPAVLADGTPLFTAVTIGLAVLGFWLQLRNGFGIPIPFPLSILFWPLHFLEWAITWAVYLSD